MIDNDHIQAALIAFLKSKSSVTSLLATAGEVREDQYQGTQYAFPAVRVQLGTQTPISGNGCPSIIHFSVLCYTEDASSQKADELAGAVNNELYNHSFNRNNVRFGMVVSEGLVAAVRQDFRTWRSEAKFKALVQIQV